MKKFQVVFQPSGRRGEIAEEKSILEVSRDMGVEIESFCGGERNCGKCKVKRIEGILSPFTDEEERFITTPERAEGYRLGCAARIRSDVVIFVPEESRGKEQIPKKPATVRPIELKPAIISYGVELTSPSLHDLLGDFERLQKTLSERYHLSSLDIDYFTLLTLSGVLRKENWQVAAAVWMDRKILDVKPGRGGDLYGLAVDVGTTTVAGYLCNLRNGELIATHSLTNPQAVYGEDVMSRIHYASTHPDGLEKLRRSIIDGLNRLIETITQGSNLSPEDILEWTVVGNTAMHHLLLGIDPQYLGVSPFTPAIHRSIDVPARNLGLKTHPSANAHFLPIEAGFVGADNVAVLIAEEPYRQDEMVLIIDIGTNGELVMGNRKRLISCSCATGPALEGGHIRFGMRAASGAIERVRIDPDTLEVDFRLLGEPLWQSESKTAKATGVCGSGIVDAIAELFRNGIIEKSGRFKDIPAPRLRTSDGGPEFVIAWKEETSIEKDITITQQDVRNVQLAKGAIYAGAKLMMRRLGIERLDQIVLAGAFGSTIDPEKALLLGMFPDCDLRNIHAVGNAAGEGARMALLNRDKRAEADEIAGRVEYMELTIEKDFQEEFIEALHFPHLRDPFPHLHEILGK
ncbi:MAG: ASKHA domain-containing protein [Thermodesulfobacteriota bacterium]